MSNTPNLFTPVRIGAVDLKNRIVMAPMTRNRAGEGLAPTEVNALYYAQRASAGLIVTEASQISPQGMGYPGTPGIYSDEQVAGWRLVTDAVHEKGGKIFLQLWHVGRISHPLTQPGGQLPVAPSAIAAPGEIITVEGPKPFVTPRALETEEIAAIVRDYAEATRRAREAGFDGVEIHGANGYLVDQFLEDGTNQRSDRYGGAIENRARFLLEVTEAVVAAWSADRVGVRLSPRGTFNGMSDSNPTATFSYAVEQLDRFGLAYLHLVDPVTDGEPRLAPVLRQLFRGPMIVAGGFTKETAEAAIAADETDLVAFGVPFIANPDLPERFAAGAPLSEPDRTSFYGGSERGYVDYPALSTVGAV
jgi:N-ethylmaleimide reductase